MCSSIDKQELLNRIRREGVARLITEGYSMIKILELNDESLLIPYLNYAVDHRPSDIRYLSQYLSVYDVLNLSNKLFCADRFLYYYLRSNTLEEKDREMLIEFFSSGIQFPLYKFCYDEDTLYVYSYYIDPNHLCVLLDYYKNNKKYYNNVELDIEIVERFINDRKMKYLDKSTKYNLCLNNNLVLSPKFNDIYTYKKWLNDIDREDNLLTILCMMSSLNIYLFNVLKVIDLLHTVILPNNFNMKDNLFKYDMVLLKPFVRRVPYYLIRKNLSIVGIPRIINNVLIHCLICCRLEEIHLFINDHLPSGEYTVPKALYNEIAFTDEALRICEDCGVRIHFSDV